MNNKIITKPNPNKEDLETIVEAVKANDGYCPCLTYKNDDTKCMCKDFRELEKTDYCHCQRFYKVVNYPILMILCAPEDMAMCYDLSAVFTQQGFIVLTPDYCNIMKYMENIELYEDMIKAKIEKADALYVINSSEQNTAFIQEFLFWAEFLNKKIMFLHSEENNED